MLKKIFVNYWELILFLGLTIFNVGYTAAKINTFVTKYELRSSWDSLKSNLANKIDVELEKQNRSLKEGYIKIEQVPGLNERLNSIDSGIKDLKEELKLLRQRK